MVGVDAVHILKALVSPVGNQRVGCAVRVPRRDFEPFRLATFKPANSLNLVTGPSKHSSRDTRVRFHIALLVDRGPTI